MKKKLGSPEDHLRTTPQQDRANETVRQILDVSASLIEERGVEGFNTNLLAETCGIRVRTVYRYFENKQAIVATLYRELTTHWHAFFEERFERIADARNDWGKECDALSEAFGALLQESDLAIAIRRAMKTNQALIDIERADNVELGRLFAEAMAERASHLDGHQLALIGTTWLNAVSSLLDIALEGPPEEFEEQQREAMLLQRAYLARCFE